jgi:hypothetical protein
MESGDVVRVVVAVCAVVFGVACIWKGFDHAVVAAVAGVLGWVLGQKVPLPSGGGE